MDYWTNILDEESLKYNLEFTAIFVMFYECFKDYIVNQVKGFYCDIPEIEDGELVYCETEEYKREVRALDSKHLDNASLKWFLQFKVISQEDYENYQLIRKRRNSLTHETLKNLCEGFDESDVQLFIILKNLYTKIDKWWINEIEIPIAGDDVPEDYDEDGVCGLQSLALSLITDIVLGDSGEKYKEILKELYSMQCE